MKSSLNWDVSSAHMALPKGNFWDIAHPYTLFTSHKIKILSFFSIIQNIIRQLYLFNCRTLTLEWQWGLMLNWEIKSELLSSHFSFKEKFTLFAFAFHLSYLSLGLILLPFLSVLVELQSWTISFAISRILESLAGCRTMFLFAVFCKIIALECNAYWFHV